jgi:hypothetical protein
MINLCNLIRLCHLYNRCNLCSSNLFKHNNKLILFLNNNLFRSGLVFPYHNFLIIPNNKCRASIKTNLKFNNNPSSSNLKSKSSNRLIFHNLLHKPNTYQELFPRCNLSQIIFQVKMICYRKVTILQLKHQEEIARIILFPLEHPRQPPIMQERR